MEQNPGASQQSTHPQRPQQLLANYQFSSEELRILRECNTESFFQRSLPFGTGLGLAAYFGVKNGYLRPSVKYGAVPKVIVGVVIGYFMGKFSYQQKCAEKLMRLPNSRLAEVLRQRKQQQGGMGLATDQNLGVGLALAPFTSSAPDVYSDEQMATARGSALNLDTESRPMLSGLDDIYRPTLDTPTTNLETELPIDSANQPGTTYDELRKKNREEYSQKQQSVYRRPPDAPAGMRQTQAAPLIRELPPSQQGQTNKYGDTWTD